MSEISTSSFTPNYGSTRSCYYGLTSYMKTSWTETNLGRRYFGCPNFKYGTHCKFFEWVDKGEVNARSCQVIPELRARNIQLEIELRVKVSNDSWLHLELKALQALCVRLVVILIYIFIVPKCINQRMLPY
jgi:hypothetical protein